MKFFTSYFHEPWKVYKAMNMDFHGLWKSTSMYFMGDESSNGPWNSHEGTIKKTHESVQLTLAQK